VRAREGRVGAEQPLAAADRLRALIAQLGQTGYARRP
jgi:hypothetical protein